MKVNSHNSISDYAATTIRCKARQLAGNSGFATDEAEDIEQELRAELLERLPRYNPAKASQNTFVARLIDNKISRLIRHRTAECRDYRRVEFSVNDTITDANGNQVERACSMNQDEADISSGKCRRSLREENDLSLDVLDVVKNLPDHLQKIAALLAKHPAEYVANMLGVSKGSLYREIAIIRGIFEDAGLREYLK